MKVINDIDKPILLSDKFSSKERKPFNYYRRSYYLLVAITQDGYLKFEEDREESAYGAEFKNRNFLNGKIILFYTLQVNTSI